MTQNGVEKTMRAAKVRAGMVLKVLKNDYIPVDGPRFTVFSHCVRRHSEHRRGDSFEEEIGVD